MSGQAVRLAALFARMSAAERREALASLPPADLIAMEHHWPLWAREEQLPPPMLPEGLAWRVWCYLAGRGAGKTRAMAEAVRAEVEAGRRMSVGLISPTADSGRRDMVRALLDVAPPSFRPSHEPSQRRIVWPSGAIGHILSAEEPDRIRGLNLDYAWLDELTSMANIEDVWSNLQLALRVPGPKGDAPCAIISTTPRRHPLLKSILADPKTVVTRSSTFANASNLDPSTLAYLRDRYSGTTLGRQELLGEMLDDLDTALWQRTTIDASRVFEAPDDMRRVVVAVDPAGGHGRQNDETGIVACGIGQDGRFFVLRDRSGRYSPDGWARRAVELFGDLNADRIVCEGNFGGAMVEATIRSVAPRASVKMVHASRGKAVRAEPIAALYEQGRVHHLGHFPQLEDQLCSWDPAGNGPSPDRLDALVWGLTDLSTNVAAGARMVRFNFMKR